MATINSTPKSASANSYLTLAEANTYMETVRPENEQTWLKQSEPTRERLLMLATRTIDDHFQFLGRKSDSTNQALQWPRSGVSKDGKWTKAHYDNFDQDTVPAVIKNATAELARHMVDSDKFAEPDGAGIKQLAVGGINLTFNEDDRQAKGVIPSHVYSMLRKYGKYYPNLNSEINTVQMAKVTR
tara:strand:- start:19 stop:573 length:555 start_codon:yes stop_codon:yes gene_type:complete